MTNKAPNTTLVNFLLGSIIVLVIPVPLGVSYATAAIPVYGIVCGHSATEFLHPLNWEDYSSFLFNKGCTLSEVQEKQAAQDALRKFEFEECRKRFMGRHHGNFDPQSPVDEILSNSFCSITPEYHGVDRYSNSGPVGGLLDTIMEFEENIFTKSTLLAGGIIIPILNANVLIRGLYYILYVLFIAVIGKYLGALASYFFNKTVGSNKKEPSS
jgi:hypothetical protein